MRVIRPAGFAAILLLLFSHVIFAESNEITGDAVRHVLPNGLRVIIVPTRLAPVAGTVVNYLVGSADSPEGFPGMAHAQEHMMFRGSPGLTADQLAGIVAAMGGMFNADTQQTVTQYFLTFPAEDLDIALHIEAIRMHSVLDKQSLWEQERGAIEQEVAQDLSNPEYLFYADVLSRMYKGTAYALSPLGTVESFDRTTAQMLRTFYNTWYKPNNAILVIVGNVDPEKTISRVHSLFGSIPSGKIPPRKPVKPGPVAAQTIHLPTDAFYGLVVVSFPMPGYNSPDFAATQVLADVLSNQRGNLFSLVSEGKALYAGFELSTFRDSGLGHAIAAFPAGADTRALVQDIKSIIESYMQTGFPPDLVDASKKTRLTKAQIQRNSVPGLANAWSRALAIEGRPSPDDLLRDIRKVSPSDIHRIARQHLRFDHAITSILDPKSSGQPVAGDVRQAKESPAPAKVREVKAPDWAQGALNKEIVPLFIKPSVFRLSNGLTLIVQPSSASETVCIYGHIKNEPDVQVAAGKEGVEEVLNQLLSFGTQLFDRISFQKALDDIGAQETPGTDFSLEVLRDDFERGASLLAQNQVYPALPEEAFRIVRKQVAATVAGRRSSPEYLAKMSLIRSLYPPNDPARREATPESVASLSLDDVKEFHRSTFRPDLTYIVVTGNITGERARAVIEKYFGKWTSPGPRPNVNLPPAGPNNPLHAIVPDMMRSQDQVILAQTLGINRSHPDYYALELGNHILGGAFYATRLYRELREESGLVYHVSSSLEMGETRSIFQIEYGCDPKNSWKVRSIITRNLKDMQERPVSGKELKQAKALLLREMLLKESGLKKIAADILKRLDLGLRIDEPAHEAQKIMDLTAEDIRAAYAKYVRPEGLSQVTQGPPR